MDEQKPEDPLIKYIATMVEAMRQDMVTKADLARVDFATKTDLAALREEFGADLAAMRQEFKVDVAVLRAEMATLSIMNAGFAAVRAEIEHISLRLDAIDRA